MWRNLILAWRDGLGGVIIATVLGSVAQTQVNLAAVSALGAPVDLGTRLQTTLHDLLSFAPTYGAIVALAFLLGFPLAALIARWQPRLSAPSFVLAGAAAIATALALMAAALGIHPIAAARSTLGFVALSAAGAVGGYAYAWLRARRKRPPQPG